MEKKINKFSSKITQDESLPAAQAMLYAIGMQDADMKKAQVGVVSTGYQGNPCNMHLNMLSAKVKQGTFGADLIGLQFHPESIMTAHGRTIIENWIKK